MSICYIISCHVYIVRVACVYTHTHIIYVTCIYTHIYVCLIHTCVCVYIYVSVCVCVYIYVSVCVCIYIHIWLVLIEMVSQFVRMAKTCWCPLTAAWL